MSDALVAWAKRHKVNQDVFENAKPYRLDENQQASALWWRLSGQLNYELNPDGVAARETMMMTHAKSLGYKKREQLGGKQIRLRNDWVEVKIGRRWRMAGRFRTYGTWLKPDYFLYMPREVFKLFADTCGAIIVEEVEGL